MIVFKEDLRLPSCVLQKLVACVHMCVHLCTRTTIILHGVSLKKNNKRRIKQSYFCFATIFIVKRRRGKGHVNYLAWKCRRTHYVRYKIEFILHSIYIFTWPSFNIRVLTSKNHHHHVTTTATSFFSFVLLSSLLIFLPCQASTSEKKCCVQS